MNLRLKPFGRKALSVSLAALAGVLGFIGLRASTSAALGFAGPTVSFSLLSPASGWVTGTGPITVSLLASSAGGPIYTNSNTITGSWAAAASPTATLGPSDRVGVNPNTISLTLRSVGLISPTTPLTVALRTDIITPTSAVTTFSILVDSDPPSVFVNGPALNSIWILTQPITVSWSQLDLVGGSGLSGNYRIFYKANSGASPVLVNAGGGATGSPVTVSFVISNVSLSLVGDAFMVVEAQDVAGNTGSAASPVFTLKNVDPPTPTSTPIPPSATPPTPATPTATSVVPTDVPTASPTNTPIASVTPNPTNRRVYLPVAMKVTPCLNSASDWCEPNGTIGTAAGPVAYNVSMSAVIGPVDKDDYYKIVVPVGDSKPFTITTVTSGVVKPDDIDVYVYQTGTSGSIARSNATGTGNETVLIPSLTAGTYYVRVVALAGNISTTDSVTYVLRISH